MAPAFDPKARDGSDAEDSIQDYILLILTDDTADL